jgi:hypothetical protein
MGKPSIGQTHQVMSILANNVDWTKTDSGLLQQFVDDPKWAGQEFQNFLNKKRILKHLQLLNPKLSISSASFSRDTFLNSKLGVKVYLWDDFKRLIVPELSETISALTINLTLYKLTKNMYDSDIRAEIGEEDVRTPDEALAIIFANVSKQPNGETGNFENNGHANIQYVRLKGRGVFVVSVCWDPIDHRWFLRSDWLDNGYWLGDRRVFAHSLSAQAS